MASHDEIRDEIRHSIDRFKDQAIVIGRQIQAVVPV